MKTEESFVIHRSSHAGVIGSLNHGEALSVPAALVRTLSPGALSFLLKTRLLDDATLGNFLSKEYRYKQEWVEGVMKELTQAGYGYLRVIAGVPAFAIYDRPTDVEDAAIAFGKMQDAMAAQGGGK
jgi:hypothetical protein